MSVNIKGNDTVTLSYSTGNYTSFTTKKSFTSKKKPLQIMRVGPLFLFFLFMSIISFSVRRNPLSVELFLYIYT